MSQEQNLEIYRGDNESFTVTVRRSNAIYNITSCTIWFTAKEDVMDADVDAVIRKSNGVLGGITITDAPAGEFTLSFVPADTAALVVPTTVLPKDRAEYRIQLYYDMQLKTGGGEVFTFAKGYLHVKSDLTQVTV